MKAVLGLLFISLFSIISCTNDSSIAPNADLEEVALQIIRGGKFQYSEKGVVNNVLEAELLERWESDGEDDEIWRVSEGFKLYIGGNRENHEAILSGGRGTYNTKTGHLIAWDDVVLINNEGEKLSTEYLVWSHDSDRMHTDRPVRIETKSGVLFGKGMEADSRFENYQILAPTGSFNLP